MRYALAGTAATVAVEAMTHGYDTINMRSKADSIKKSKIVNNLFLDRFKGFTSLFTGITAVVYGYAFSSMIYFYTYANLRDS